MKKFLGIFFLSATLIILFCSFHLTQAQNNPCSSYSGFPTVTLRRGSTNTEANKQLQCALIARNVMTLADINYGAEGGGFGIYGPKTSAAVLQLQQQLKQQDPNFNYSSGPGVYGPLTQNEVGGQITNAPNAYDLTSYYINNVGIASTEPLSDGVRTNFTNGDYEIFSNTNGSSFYDKNNQLLASYAANGDVIDRGAGTLPSELSDLYPPYLAPQRTLTSNFTSPPYSQTNPTQTNQNQNPTPAAPGVIPGYNTLIDPNSLIPYKNHGLYPGINCQISPIIAYLRDTVPKIIQPDLTWAHDDSDCRTVSGNSGAEHSAHLYIHTRNDVRIVGGEAIDFKDLNNPNRLPKIEGDHLYFWLTNKLPTNCTTDCNTNAHILGVHKIIWNATLYCTNDKGINWYGRRYTAFGGHYNHVHIGLDDCNDKV